MKTSSLILALALSAAPGALLAQTTEGVGVEEIVVTAQRRAENLQSVPIAVTAITAQALQKAGISSTADLAAATPGLTITSSLARTQPFLRGVGTQGTNPGEEGSIATYVDGVYIGSLSAGFFALNNVERIEVLKGPQGTLFGRNATGGLIHVITKTPGSEPEFNGFASYGNYETFEGSAYASTPLGEKAAIDLSAYAVHQGKGWGRNLVTGDDINFRREWLVRSKLRYDFSADTQLVLSADYQKNTSDLGMNRNLLPGSTAAVSRTPFRGTIYDSQMDQNGTRRQENYGVSATLTHEMSFATLKSVTASRIADGTTIWDLDTSPISLVFSPQFHDRLNTFQQEFLLTGSTDRLNWTAGVFYYSSKSHTNPLSLRSGLQAAQRLDRYALMNTESYAGFAQGAFKLTDATTITAGLRYTKDKRDMAGIDVAAAGNASPAGTVLRRAFQKATYDKLTYRFALDHQLADDVLAYASYSRGFKSGMFNGTNPFQPGADPETLDAMEAGVKSQWFDRRLRLNGAIFHYDYKDIQLVQVNPGQTIILNAASGRIKGADVELTAVPYDGVGRLEVTGGLSVLDAHYRRFPNAPILTPNPAGGNIQTAGDGSGKRMIRTPKFTTNISLNYSVPVGELLLEASGTWYHNDGFFFEADNRIFQKAYDTVNAQVALGPHSGRWRVRAFARNLFDEAYYQLATVSTTSDAMGPAPPRTFGVAIDFKR